MPVPNPQTAIKLGSHIDRQHYLPIPTGDTLLP